MTGGQDEPRVDARRSALSPRPAADGARQTGADLAPNPDAARSPNPSPFESAENGASHDVGATPALLDGPALRALILGSLEDDKAVDVVAIDTRDKSSVTDVMIIASGRSARHVGAIADHLSRALKEAGHGKARMEGQAACDWVLIDAGDAVVHLFRPEVRAYYNLETMWSDETSASRSA